MACWLGLVPTANKALKYLRVALGAAWKDGLTLDNPAAKLDVIKRRDARKTLRTPTSFTIKEIEDAARPRAGRVKGLILFGLYTGQRLKDIARLTWHNVDLVEKELRFRNRQNRSPDGHSPRVTAVSALTIATGRRRSWRTLFSIGLRHRQQGRERQPALAAIP